MWRNKRLRALLWLVLGAPVASVWGQAPNSCLDCHSALDAPLQVTAEQFSHDVHSQRGLDCASCHGGDPTKMDMDAMGKAAGFRGKIQRSQIPALCGKCHSDGAYMRQFNPSLRTDQLSQYVTSVHGKLLAKGDTKVAVCTDCHGVHDLRPPRNAQSKVHPLNIAQTCARCHADVAYMKGHGIPTDQYANYNASVHHEALTVRGDLSAPTCTTCHGNHGAAPPGVGSVQNVCSTCHVFQDQMFEKSTHKAAFQAASLPGCIVCHNNHNISHPTDAKLGTGPQSTCVRCHTPGDACDQATKEMLAGLTRLNGAIQEADRVLGVAESSGMEVSEARLEEDQARDSLTKARVTIHSFRKELVEQDIQAGLKLAAKNVQAGKDALKERDYRRAGLGFSLVAIALVVLGLWLYIRKTEQTA
jgi:cytochrome c3-like protein